MFLHPLRSLQRATSPRLHLLSSAAEIFRSRRQFAASALPLAQASDSNAHEIDLKGSLAMAGVGIASSVGAHVAISITQPEWVMEQAPLLVGTGLLASVLGIACRKTANHPSDHSPPDHSVDQCVDHCVPSNKWSFGAVCIGWTSLTAPLVIVAGGDIDPLIWPAAVLLSSTTVGLSSLWALAKPTLSPPLHLHGAIKSGLYGIVAFNNFMMLPVTFQASDSIISHGMPFFFLGSGIAIYTAINVCEIQSATQLARKDQFDRFRCSVNVLIIFCLLTVVSGSALIRIVATQQNKTKK